MWDRAPLVSLDCFRNIWHKSPNTFIIVPMNSAIQKFLNYSRLEAQRGFDNRAVVGGLENMLEPWEAEARETQLPEHLIQLITGRLRDYARLSADSRAEMLTGLWNRIEQDIPETRGSYSPDPARLIKKPAPKPPTAGEPASERPTAVQTESTSASPQAPQPARDSTPKDPEEGAELPAKAEVSPSEAVDEEPEVPAEPPAALGAPLTTISGIGPRSAKTLKKLDLESLGDLLWHLPRRYDDYSQLKTINKLWYGEEVTIIGTVEKVHVRKVRNRKLSIIEAVVSDGTGSIRVTWFNQQWIAKRLSSGDPIVLSGKIDQYLGRLVMKSPDWEMLERENLHTNRIVPVYPLTAGIHQKWLRKVIYAIVDRYAKRIPDPLPASIRSSAAVEPLPRALRQIHFPDDWDSLHKAQQRLSFDELFLLQLGVIRQKRAWEELQTRPFEIEDTWLDSFTSALPYTLTDAQHRALKDIRTDLAAPKPMNRLLEGDVGSGKTIVAAAAIGITAANQAQSAIMAPTSILAEQHFHTLSEVLPSAAGIDAGAIRLLIGATPEAEKSAIREGLADGSIVAVVGTHALLEDPVTFDQLGLVIIDEQHRFGVEQRAQLRAKGENPHLLVMTATPIPRSLALTVYGDLNLSVIDEMPPGRQPIETHVFLPSERLRAHRFIITQLEKGHQAFIIFPLVEESEKVDAKAAVEEHKTLQEGIFHPYRLGLLHGRMKPEEKEAVMQQFRHQELDILVSTSVVEVGVDVPNASVILIEGANRFGLAQLHQFRGRVGRGPMQAYCILIPDSEDEGENQRLAAMERTSDGFELAELDLNQRGPGDFLGTRQSGFLDLRLARLSDVVMIEKARREAVRLVDDDPNLEKPEHAFLSKELDRFWNVARGERS